MDEKKFIDLYQRQKETGLTVKEFCSNEIIAPATFYYWKKKLQRRNGLPDFIPVVVNSTPTFSQSNLPKEQFSPTNNGNPIEIEFSNKTILRINSELDLPMLKALIHLND
jgi:hypothetical protein